MDGLSERERHNALNEVRILASIQYHLFTLIQIEIRISFPIRNLSMKTPISVSVS